MSITAVPEQLAPTGQELNVRDLLEVIRRRKGVFFQTFALVLAVGIVVTALSKPVYRTAAKITVPIPQNTVSITDAKDPLSTVLMATQPDPVSTQLQVMQSSKFQREVKDRANVKPIPGVIPSTVKVALVEGTQNVIQITGEGGSPADTQKLVQATVDLHQRNINSASAENVLKAKDFVSEQLINVQGKLREAEGELIDFKKSHNVVQLQAEGEMRAKELVDLDAQVRQAEADIQSSEEKLIELRRRLAREPKDLEETTLRDNPRKQKLRDRVDELDSQRLEALKLYKPNSREIQEIDQQLAIYRTQYEAEPATLESPVRTPNPVYSSLMARVAEMETTLMGQTRDLNAARSRLRATRASSGTAQGVWEITLNRLTRERDRAQASVDFLESRLQDLEIRAAAKADLVHRIQEANLPTVPFKPNRVVNIGLTVLLALFLGAGMAFAQEYLDDRVNSPEEVERLTALPTLGHVPMIDGQGPRMLTEMATNSHIAEAYRGLRSGIGFAALDAPIRRLQVTSASKGEGKSTTSVNLATAMAMDGKRVILVDADLRRPSVHRALQLPNTPGLSEVLVGMRSVEDALHPTGVDNLRVMTAGPIPPNPAELLGSQAFDRLVEQLEEIADVVIYDTPPCMPVTDPLIVSSRMDGVIVVLHVGQTRKAAIRHVIQQLNRARARVIGVVFNRVQPRKGGYYYNYYYYSGDGYYADTAERGEKHRRNGRKRLPRGEKGKSLVVAGRQDENGEA